MVIPMKVIDALLDLSTDSTESLCRRRAIRHLAQQARPASAA